MKTFWRLVLVSLFGTTLVVWGEETTAESWFEAHVERTVVADAAARHGIYIRLVAAGDYGPETACYEIECALSPEQLSHRLNRSEPVEITFARSSPGGAGRTVRTMTGFAFAWFLEDLIRNDVMALPEEPSSSPVTVMRVEDPYYLCLAVKMEDRFVWLRRDSTHDLLRSAHRGLRKEWGEPGATDNPDSAGFQAEKSSSN